MEPGIAGNLANIRAGKDADARLCALVFEQRNDVLRRTVAEQLAQLLFVVGDPVLFHQRDEIRRGVAGQRRLREMRIRGEEMLRAAMEIRKVAAPAPGNEDLLAGTLRAL